MSAIFDAHKKVGVELLYNTVHRKFNQLVTRCGREDQHPAEGALRSPIEQLQFGDQTSWGSDELETRCGRENQHPAQWALRPPIEQLQLERSAVLFGLQLPLTHNPFK